MKVTKKEFSQYLGVSYKTACKDYRYYLELVNKQPDHFLTVFDIMKVDCISFEQYFQIIKWRVVA